jgi:hypothetical protein
MSKAKGKRGPRGVQGPVGPRGKQGRAGKKGTTGVRGPRGPRGSKEARAELAHFDRHIERIYREINTTIARMGQIQKEVDELKARLQRFVSGHGISN